MGRSREGVSKNGEGVGSFHLSPHPLPQMLILPLFFLPFASVWKRKGNGCYAGYSKYGKIFWWGKGALGIPSIDHNEYECRLFFPADCVTWLYSTLFFSTKMEYSGDECQVIHFISFNLSEHQTVAC